MRNLVLSGTDKSEFSPIDQCKFVHFTPRFFFFLSVRAASKRVDGSNAATDIWEFLAVKSAGYLAWLEDGFYA